MDNLLKKMQSLQEKLLIQKAELDKQKKILRSKDFYSYRLVLTNPEQVVSFIEWSKSLAGQSYVTSLNKHSKAAYEDQLFFTDTVVVKKVKDEFEDYDPLAAYDIKEE